MYGIALEYTVGDCPPDPSARAACRDVLVRRPGYRRRLALMADGWRRAVDLFLYDSPEAARAALASEGWRVCAVAHSACRNAAPALLVDECPYGGPVTLLRTAPRPTRGGQACWRDHLANAEPEAVLW